MIGTLIAYLRSLNKQTLRRAAIDRNNPMQQATRIAWPRTKPSPRRPSGRALTGPSATGCVIEREAPSGQPTEKK